MSLPASAPHIVRFAEFEVNLRAGELHNAGRKVKLQERPFQVLTVLLEHGGEIVTREELSRRVWSVDTFVDFDHNLAVAVKKIREALGDSVDKPRFVETVGKRGYRFIAPIEVDGTSKARLVVMPLAGEKGNVDERVEEPHTTTAAPVAALPRHPAKYWLWLLGLAVVAALAVISIVILRRKPTLAERDLILIADFDNSTGNPVFDSALKQGLSVELGQSPFLNIVSDARVQDTLQYMGRPPDTRVFPPLAREVCQRLNAKVLLSGSVARLGSHYVIGLEAVNCLTGDSLAREQGEADNSEQVLRVLGLAASRLRRQLGESIESIQRFDVPLDQATTPSLEALKSYALGRKERLVGKEVEAIPFFQHAIELDPAFAMAYGQMATAYNNLGETDKAAQYLQKAVGLARQVSERERLFLLTRYYYIATGELDKSIETAEVWARTYPRDWLPYDWLAPRDLNIGQYEKAVTAARRSLELQPQPTSYSEYANLAAAYRALNRFAEAEEISRKALQLGHDNFHIHEDLYALAFIRGDQAAMDREFANAQGPANEETLLDDQSGVSLASGKLGLAMQLSRRAQDGWRRQGFTEQAAFSMAWSALSEADLGNGREARSIANEVLRVARGIDARETAAEALALAGHSTRAKEVADELQKRFPKHTVLNHACLPTIAASIELQHGTPERAIELLEQARPYDLSEFSSLAPIYVRGLAYLRAGHGKEAGAEFQKILDHPGIAVWSPRHSLALLGLARSYAVAGDRERSRHAYDEFLKKWADADPGIPVLSAARFEYGR